MNILDHRILIPKSPDTVWAYLSDLSRNSSWQTDCTAVSFISSRHTGAGVRYRSTLPSGRDYVIETTAWYDGLGYEYLFVDGAPFKEARGRIRLQEIPEGTIVQWTFTYDVGGFLSGVRNAVSMKRQLESTMIDSLRKLWKVMQQTPEPHREAKSLMRDAPDYEARMQYKPRHPSAKGDSHTPEPVEKQNIPPVPPPPPAPIIAEPPILEEDTRPRAPVVVPVDPDPAFLVSVASAQMNTPVEVEASISDADVIESVEPGSRPEPEQAVVVEKHESPVTETLYFDQKVESPTAEPVLPVSQPVEEVPIVPAPVMSPEQLSRLDTREISVFDLFGVPKPSQTQTMKAVPPVQAEPIEAEPVEMSIPVVSLPEPVVPVEIYAAATSENPVVTLPMPDAVAVEEPQPSLSEVVALDETPVTSKYLNRVGLRLRLRRKRVRLRWPGG